MQVQMIYAHRCFFEDFKTTFVNAVLFLSFLGSLKAIAAHCLMHTV